MTQKTLVASCYVLVFAFMAATYAINGNELARSIYSLIPPLLALLMALAAVDTYRLDNIHGRAMLFFSGAMFCLFVGESLFLVYQRIFDVNPFPSIADIFYLSAYPLLLAGLLTEIWHHKISWDKNNRTVYMLLIALLALLVPFMAYFGVYKAWDPTDTFFTNIIAIGYGVNDLLLIIPVFFVLGIALNYRGGKLYRSWVGIFIAILLMMVSDVLFAIYKDPYDNSVYPYTMIDLVFAASFLFFAYSFYYVAANIEESRKLLRAKLNKTGSQKSKRS